MKKFVLDNSVVMSWCFEDEKTAYCRKILECMTEARSIVPSLWPFELANVLLMAEKKKRLSPAKVHQFLRYLEKLPIDIDQTSVSELVEGCLDIARHHDLTAYDAAYLFLAVREQIPLATFDTALIKAARKLNIEIL